MPKEPTGDIVRHTFALRKYENHLVGEMADRFEVATRKLTELLTRYDPTISKRNLRMLVVAANKELERLYSQAENMTTRELKQLGRIESEFAAGVLERSVGAGVDITSKRLSLAMVESIIKTNPIQGAVMGEWWKSQKQHTKNAFRRQVQLGLSESESVPDLVRRIRGRSIGGGRYKGGVMNTSTRQAEALVRTAVNEVTTQAHLATYEANDDVTEMYEIVVTFDSRTTDICISMDGRTFKYDDPDRRTPPFHYNCRSTIAPIVDWEGLGIKPPPEGTRATKTGPMTSKPSRSAIKPASPGSVAKPRLAAEI